MRAYGGPASKKGREKRLENGRLFQERFRTTNENRTAPERVKTDTKPGLFLHVLKSGKRLLSDDRRAATGCGMVLVKNARKIPFIVF